MDIKSLFFIGIIAVVIFFAFSGNIDNDCYPPYKHLKNYSINNSNFQFTINNEQATFAVVDSTCEVIQNKQAEDIFENYFTLQYEEIIDSTPQDIRDIEDATDFIINLVEEPFKNVKSEEIKELTDKMSSFMKSIKTVEKINTISSEYNLLYSYADSSLRDEELTKEEVYQVQEKTSKFIFIFLDETNQVQNFVNEFVDSNFVEFLFKADKWLKGIEIYKDKREAFMTEQIRRILFDVPIDFTYENLNG